MANLADEYGTDVELYVKPLTTTIHADTPTSAPAALHNLLEQLGLKRHEYPTGAPLYIWHTVPDDLAADEQRRLATRAIPALRLAGYKVNCTPEVFDEAASQQAAHEARARTTHASPRNQAPAPSSSRPAPARRTP
ncbi:hypothetical protein [Streptomyces sp. NRRL B-24572]|uniref:hypothetical protein n=1 Tax=Streptomyces sp. NRRL B-24572 TaxID=1962156 RepID=UPI000A36ED1E|nr:hypothetical protein [Streptomyces sp. NRRL B-24572]